MKDDVVVEKRERCQPPEKDVFYSFLLKVFVRS